MSTIMPTLKEQLGDKHKKPHVNKAKGTIQH